MATKKFYVALRQEYQQKDGGEFRVTINRESLTVDTRCAQKLYDKCKDWDIDLDGGTITLHGSFEVNR